MVEQDRQGNRLLRNMPAEAFEAIAPHLNRMDAELFKVLGEPGERIDQVYFPESCVVSLVSPFLDGRQPELASIGWEGVAGCVAAIGSRERFGRWTVQVEGAALACPAKAFEQTFDGVPSFRQTMVCYMDALLCQTMQSVACNAIHPVEARCCRWILMMRDRSEAEDLPLTQEFLAELLAVHRSSVSIVTNTLQQAGFIQAKRGSIRILDREGLKNTACECYRLVRDRYDQLLPGTFQ